MALIDQNQTYDTSNWLYSGYNIAFGQSFVGNGAALKYSVFSLSKLGVPTGTIYVKLYAHSGTYGVSSIPTGSPLATATGINIGLLITTFQDIIFTFPTPYTLVNGTYYCIVIEFSGGNSTNYLNVRCNYASVHGGNYSEYRTSWEYYSNDLFFRLFDANGYPAGPYYLTDIDIATVVYECLDITAPATLEEAQGWTCDKKVSLASPYVPDTIQASGTFVAEPSAFAAKGYRTAVPINNTFANTNWVLWYKVKCNAYYAQTGRVKFRLWRSVNANGSGATQITPGWQQSIFCTFTAPNTYFDGMITWSPGATVTLTNEYLFLEIEWYAVASGGNNSAAVYWVHNEGVTERLVTPSFVPTGNTYEAAAGFAVGAGLGQGGERGLFPGLALGARGGLIPATPTLTINPAMGLQAGAGMAPGSQGNFGREVQFAALTALGLSPANLVSLAMTLAGAAAQLQQAGLSFFSTIQFSAASALEPDGQTTLNLQFALAGAAGVGVQSQGNLIGSLTLPARVALALSPANLLTLTLNLAGAAAQLQQSGLSLAASLNLPAAGDLTASPDLYLNLALSLPGAAGLDAQAQNDLAATLTLPLSVALVPQAHNDLAATLTLPLSAALALSPANLVSLSLNLAGAAAQLSQAGLELSASLSFPATAAAISQGGLELQLTLSLAGAAALIPQAQGDFVAALTLPLNAALEMSPQNFVQASLACAALAMLDAFWTGAVNYEAALSLTARIAVDWQAGQALAAALNLNAAALAAYDLRGDWGAELGLGAGVQVDSQAEGDFIAALPLSVLAGAELLAGRTVLATAPLEVRAGMVAGAGLEQSANLALAALTALEISGQQVIVASIGLDAVAAWGLEAAADLLAATVLGGRAEFTLDLPPLRIVCRGNLLLVLLLPQSADVKLS